VGLDYDVRPGREEMFETAFRATVARLAEVPGHLRTRLYRDLDRPGSYLLCSEWADAAALAGFLRSAAFAAVTQWGRGVLAGPPRHQLLGAEP